MTGQDYKARVKPTRIDVSTGSTSLFLVLCLHILRIGWKQKSEDPINTIHDSLFPANKLLIHHLDRYYIYNKIFSSKKSRKPPQRKIGYPHCQL
jgi:hypothetical protein